MALRQSLTPRWGESLHGVWVPKWWRKARTAWLASAWLARRVYEAGRWSVRHPLAAVALVFVLWLAWAVLTYGWAPVTAAALFTAFTANAGLAEWAERWPTSYARHAATPARSHWRRFRIYRWRWHDATRTADLTIAADGIRRYPQLRRVHSDDTGDTAHVTMLPGQTLDDWWKATERLTQTFGAKRVRAHGVDDDPHAVVLRCMTSDPLTADVPLPEPATEVDLEAVPVGIREDGKPLTLPLLYSHLLVGGETGSGKGSVLYALLCGIAPAIQQDLVRVLAIDNKAGMELGLGEPLYERFVYETADTADLLEQAVVAMRNRAARLRVAGSRKFVPTPGDPLMVVVIDELASLVAPAYVPDRDLLRRITAALLLLLTQGRAVGVCVVAATQDVRIETISMRGRFRYCIGLRASDPEQADMLLGRGARERGALTDRIPHALPGVAYVLEDGNPEPVRARFSHVTDEDIAALVEHWSADVLA